jgi:hypothetical protein
MYQPDEPRIECMEAGGTNSLISRMTDMNESKQATSGDAETASLLLGAGLALASLIILPAVAQRIGLGSALTIALRGALMRASNKV